MKARARGSAALLRRQDRIAATHDPVKAPAAQLISAACESNDRGSGALLDRCEQSREAVTESTAVGRLVAAEVAPSVLDKHGHAIGVASRDLFDELFVCLRLVDDCEDVTHAMQDPIRQLNGS
jgi:hypothetical protein